MPKLLDFIKEKGLTHDDVIKLLSASEESTVSEEEIEDDEEDVEEEVEEVIEEEDTEIEDDTDVPKTFTLKDVEKLISKAIEGTRKAKRKAPSKGKKGQGTPQKPIYTREDMFEEMF